MPKTRERILIVDDNPVNCAICEEILRDDYRLCVAGSGQEALRAAERFLPDLVLLDVMMPDLDGFAVCRQLRKSSRGWTKIIMLSARAQTESRLAGYSAGADDYLTKPFDEEELQAKVRVHLRLRHAEEINELKDGLLKVLQHGNRTPMAGLLGGVDVLDLVGKDLSTAECREHLKSIHRSARRLQSWLASGEQLIALKTGVIQPALTETNISALAQQFLDNRTTSDSRVELRVQNQISNCGVTLVDDSLLRDLLDRLVSYAMENSDGDRSVQLQFQRATQPVETLQIAVTFARTPLDFAAMADLFEPFADPYAVLHNRTDGMSLAIVREIAVLHGGFVQARNLPEGRFLLQVSLPVHAVCTEKATPDE
ncbi:MAG: hypothetical protein Fues2KO_10470 [Fuerstiella sp.]